MNLGEAHKKLETILFLSSEPIDEETIAALMEIEKSALRKIIQELGDHYEGHALCVRRISGKWRVETRPEMENIAVRLRDADRPLVRLTKAALETLSVVAYHQPVTRGEIEEIRGVRCERVIQTLLKHGLVRVAGRRKTTGTPLQYRTTQLFMEEFGLDSLRDMPSLDELKAEGLWDEGLERSDKVE